MTTIIHEQGVGKLRIIVDEADAARILFDQIEVWRSEESADGPFYELTADKYLPARVPSASTDEPLVPVTGSSVVLSGQKLALLLNELEKIEVTFTGSDPLTLAGAALQVNTQVGDRVRAYVDGNGVFTLQTVAAGGGATLRVLESEGAVRLGLPIDVLEGGKEARIPLKHGVAVYPFVDLHGSRDFYYRVRFRNRLDGTFSAFESAVKANTPLGLESASVALGFLKLVGLDGRPLSNVEVTVYNAYLGDLVDGWLVAQTNASKVTDENGYVEFTLARGARVTVAVVGTSIVRDITVPTDTSEVIFPLLGPNVGEDDVFTVQVPELNYAARRSP